jgi:hypothetical protein
MKRVTIIISPNIADTTAQWLFENSIRVLLSYSKDEFFDSKIVIICGVPDENFPAFQTKFSSLIKS